MGKSCSEQALGKFSAKINIVLIIGVQTNKQTTIFPPRQFGLVTLERFIYIVEESGHKVKSFFSIISLHSGLAREIGGSLLKV